MTKAEEISMNVFPDLKADAEGHKDALGTIVQMSKRIGFQVGYEEAEKKTIEKACEWLKKWVGNYVDGEYNEFHRCMEYSGDIDKERLLNDFKKAME